MHDDFECFAGIDWATEAPGQQTEQRDVEILRSLPGIGRIVLATLLAEAPRPLRDRDYHALGSLSGVAPVTRGSGKRCVVVMRKACHMRWRWRRLPLGPCRHPARSRQP